MKQAIFYLPTIILTMLLMSCSGNKIKTENEILGKWRFTKVDTDVAASDNAIREKIVTSLRGNTELMTVMSEKFSIIEFRENGVVNIDGKLGNYFVDGTKLSFEGEKDSDFVDFRIVEDTLVFSYNFPKNLYELMKSAFQIPDNVKVDKCGVNIFFVKEE
ncbi:hypothetical protein [Dysgonomonas sp. Marseille-P4361]|uniref:hypothetical protein n=1 Tax=Dysgonomonas sp. Marseille-P4361 TaxID=2161820 RepID=UPI000D550561|nr:hypothetical protein [Dysgonomonas sp. Marseille-P4361]